MKRLENTQFYWVFFDFKGGVMLKITKKQREELRQKYDGRCAYCGIILPKRWHADHLIPIRRGSDYKAEFDVFDNLMPSCPQCNIAKHEFSIADWKEWIKIHIRSLNKQANYRVAKSFGLIEEREIDVVFYFEKVKNIRFIGGKEYVLVDIDGCSSCDVSGAICRNKGFNCSSMKLTNSNCWKLKDAKNE